MRAKTQGVKWEMRDYSRRLKCYDYFDYGGNIFTALVVGGSPDLVVAHKSLLDPNPNPEGVTLYQLRVERCELQRTSRNPGLL